MSDEITIHYRFTFEKDVVRQFTVGLDAKTLAYHAPQPGPDPEWARLEFHRCENCPLQASKHRCCPPAANISPIVDTFAHTPSTRNVQVSVVTPDREFRKDGAFQSGLSSLVGLIMVTSGCPILDKLRPMAHTHLPFANSRETTYRAVSMYLLAQFFRQKRGKRPDWHLRELLTIYADIKAVNHHFAQRLSNVNTRDANINSLVRLDCFASAITLSIVGDWWEEIERFFLNYLD